MRKEGAILKLVAPMVGGVEARARDLIADAYAHPKFIGFSEAALPLLQRAGAEPEGDDGVVPLRGAADMAGFVADCRKLRCWERGPRVKQV